MVKVEKNMFLSKFCTDLIFLLTHTKVHCVYVIQPLLCQNKIVKWRIAKIYLSHTGYSQFQARPLAIIQEYPSISRYRDTGGKDRASTSSSV